MDTTRPARIQNKHDIEANWLKSSDFIPMLAEMIIYDREIDENGNILELPSGRTEPYVVERVKVGDGIHEVNDLPFFGIIDSSKVITEVTQNLQPTLNSKLDKTGGVITQDNSGTYNTPALKIIPGYPSSGVGLQIASFSNGEPVALIRLGEQINFGKFGSGGIGIQDSQGGIGRVEYISSTGELKAGYNKQTPTTSLLRNSKLSATETNPSSNGEIVWTYE